MDLSRFFSEEDARKATRQMRNIFSVPSHQGTANYSCSGETVSLGSLNNFYKRDKGWKCWVRRKENSCILSVGM